jgi:hypothetical protein
MVAYLTVTAHWIDSQWELRSELLAFLELEGSHSGENIGQELYDILLQAGIQDKVQNLTADNVTVNNKSIRVLGQLLERGSIDFHAKEQWSQYISFFESQAPQTQEIHSCFSHAIAIAEGSSLMKLSHQLKKSG